MLLGAMQINLTRRPELNENDEEITEGKGHLEGGGHGFEVGDYKRWEKFAIGINAWQVRLKEVLDMSDVVLLVIAS